MNVIENVTGTLVNKVTGLKIHGEVLRYTDTYVRIRIDGTHAYNSFNSDEWNFEPDPALEPDLRIWRFTEDNDSIWIKIPGEKMKVINLSKEIAVNSYSTAESLDGASNVVKIYDSSEAAS